MPNEHLTTAELYDYARGLLRGIHPHIAQCAECSNLLALLRKVKEAAVTVDVPAEIVQEAKRVFTLPKSEAAPGRLREVIARLVFLNAPGEQLAAVRSAQTARQALYRYEDFVIDLRAESDSHSVRTSLAGQIANQREPLRAIKGAPVALLSGKQVLVNTTCNEFGEFALDFSDGHPLSLRFELQSQDLSIEVLLRDLMNED